MLKVAVGSLNKAKIAGVTEAFKIVFRKVYVIPVKVPSSVPNQPLDLNTILRGAINRAKFSLEKVNADYGVGIEAGVFKILNHYFDVQISAVYDGKNIGLGISPGFLIPPKFMKQLFLGKELEEVVNEYYNVHDIGDTIGFIGLLTKGMVNRKELTYYATLMALTYFINKDLFE